MTFMTGSSFPTSFNEAAGIPRGKLWASAFAAPGRQLASMRPRVFPAENVLQFNQVRTRRLASMRPRVFPAENHAGDGLAP